MYSSPAFLTIAFQTLLLTVHAQAARPCLPDSIAHSKPCMPVSGCGPVLGASRLLVLRCWACTINAPATECFHPHSFFLPMALSTSFTYVYSHFLASLTECQLMESSFLSWPCSQQVPSASPLLSADIFQIKLSYVLSLAERRQRLIE